MNPFDSFFPSHICTYISDSNIDFVLPEDGFSLTESQRTQLQQHVSTDINIVYSPRQVHGDEVIVVDQSFCDQPKLLFADAIMTDRRGVALGVRTADCLPIFIYDPKHEAIALVHAGWRGTHDGIAAKVITRMQQTYQTDPQSLLVALGPCIREEVYEVGKEFVGYFPEHVSQKDEKFFMDLIGANMAQLKKSGIEDGHLFDCGMCSYSSDKCHSYRRDGDDAGRILSVMMIKEKE